MHSRIEETNDRSPNPRTIAQMSSLSDEDLMLAARRGDSFAFGIIWARHYPALLAAIRSFTNFDAEDLAQDAFVKVLLAVQSGGGPNGAVRAYLVQAAKHLAIDMSRRAENRASCAYTEEIIEHGSLDDHADAVFESHALSEALDSLQPRWQAALRDRYLEDRPVKECAVRAGMTPNSATLLIRRARGGLRSALVSGPSHRPRPRSPRGSGPRRNVGTRCPGLR